MGPRAAPPLMQPLPPRRAALLLLAAVALSGYALAASSLDPTLWRTVPRTPASVLGGLAASGATAAPASKAGPVVLPIEVIGADGTVREVSVDVTDAGAGAQLALRVHRGAYQDASTNPERGAKASVRLNGGPWVGLTNETATCAPHEAAYGCLNGALHTVRLTVPLSQFGAPGLRDGANEVAFRFNGTDTFTSGYRVLALDVETAGGASVLAPGQFTDDDPAAWTAPRPADVAEGRRLWDEAGLDEYPGGPRLVASCGSCHARDGRDLEYYAFSNRSIEERSRFHGLTQTEAEQVASYVRSLRADAGVERRGRPWNPPYQPGPGLDGRPVEAWAAGAGLDAVLETDRDMLPHLFPNGTSAEALAEVLDTRATHNARETPVALQLPDWQAWLPEVAPEDVWAGTGFQDGWAYGDYRRTRQALEDDRDGLVADGDAFLDQVDRLRAGTDDWIGFMRGPVPCVRYEAGDASTALALPLRPRFDGLPPRERCQAALRSLNHWSAVKHWEVMHEFSLEATTAEVYAYGEARGWPGRWRQVFEMGPHRSGFGSRHHTFQTLPVGDYFTTAWYHLQVVLNAGNRDPRNHFPPDWKYTQVHVFHDSENTGTWQALRHVQTTLKAYQNLDMRGPDGLGADRSADGDGWWFWHVTPTWFYAADSRVRDHWTRLPRELDAYEPGLRLRVFDALLATWLDKTESYGPEDWGRWPEPAPGEPYASGPQKLDPASYVPTAGDDIGHEHFADQVYRLVPELRAEGVDGALLNRLADWGETMWPDGDWDAVRVDPVRRGGGTGLTADYFDNPALDGDPALTRTDPRVDFDWAGGPPADGLPADGFSVRWAGEVEPLWDGDVTFHVRVDDGARLWVDGALVIDEWRDQAPAEYTATVALAAGERVPLRLEYYENAGGAAVDLAWSGAGTARTVVPQGQLYPAGETVCLSAEVNGRYVVAESAGADPLIADRAACGPWERFTIEPLDGGAVALRADANGLYVAVRDDGSLLASDAQPSARARFAWEDQPDGAVCLRSEHADRYVAAESAGADPLVANRTACRGWERFTSTPADPETETARAALASAAEAPNVLDLGAPYPNPARSSATVPYAVPESGPVRLDVVDALGRQVAVLVDGERPAGAHEAQFDTGALAAGVYVVRIQAGGEARAVRVSVVR